MKESVRQRVAVVGAGIVGLAHAWTAARRGWNVLLFDRDDRARGASIRNFGMIWPIGQPAGPLRQTALRSRQLWGDLVAQTGVWGRPTGSLHLAYRQDELAVLSEFAEMAPSLGYDCELLPPAAAIKLSPAVHPEKLLAALWSANEFCVDPREVIGRVPGWLAERFGVKLHFGTPIDRVAERSVASPNGDRWEVDRIVIATGANFRTLYPDLFLQAGFRRCKLQMLRTRPQPGGWILGPMLAGGLTLRHYEAFRECPSLPALKDRIASETPELDQYGIHVMATQNGLGEVVLGDSHEYGGDISPFDKPYIDELMLRELRKIITLPDWAIQERWHGQYAVSDEGRQFVREPEPNVHIVTASGGAGMTMSFGFAEELWSLWDGNGNFATPDSGAAGTAATTRNC
jgi:FAD dependent oxidoreductase TIGR03364